MEPLLGANILYARLELIKYDLDLMGQRMDEFDRMGKQIKEIKEISATITRILVVMEDRMKNDKIRYKTQGFKKERQHD